MIKRSYFYSCHAFALITAILFFCALLPAEASSLAGAVKGLNPGQINSLTTMKTALQLLQTAHLETAKNDTPDLKLQRLIVEKSGECVSRIILLVQKSDSRGKTKKETASKLFALNNKIITGVLGTIRREVEQLQENKLDNLEDTTAFFTSAEWQQPQYIISLASYWLSWNIYYWCTFFPGQENCSAKMLPEAVKGFSRSSIDFREDIIITRSLFGRSLCYKQMQQYDKAIQDLNSVIKRIPPGDSLYFRTRYEKILISYLSGNFKSAMNQLNHFQEDITGKKVSGEFKAGIRKLKIKINLALLETTEEKDKKKLKSLHYTIFNELKQLTEIDEKDSGKLYKFVKENTELFASLPYSRLGPIGSLAIADWNFNNKKYEKAISGYRNLFQAKNSLIKKRADDLSFRIGYAFCQRGDWTEAISVFKKFFNKHASSNLRDKSAGIYYFAASQNYKENPTKITYRTYINAIKIYLEYCSDPEDRNEAHFLLGEYYLEENQNNKAAKEFLKVGKNSSNYIQARYYGIRSNIDILETNSRKGLSKSKKALQLYKETIAIIEAFRTVLKEQKNTSNTDEIETHSAILLAKLYIYGPDKTVGKGLDVLSGTQKYFSGQKNKELLITARRLKMECYCKLNMFAKAKKEISRLVKADRLNLDTWTLLNEFGSSFYHSSVKSRNEKDIKLANKHAELAIMIYEALSAFAKKDLSYKQFYTPIQLRLAEMHLNTNNTESAKKIHHNNLQQNPSSADSIYNLGLISEKEGRWEDALETWRRFSDGVKNGSHYWFESRYHTAKALHELGQTESACELLNMTIVLHPKLRNKKFKKEFLGLRDKTCKPSGITDSTH